jgi:hypothetical protein
VGGKKKRWNPGSDFPALMGICSISWIDDLFMCLRCVCVGVLYSGLAIRISKQLTLFVLLFFWSVCIFEQLIVDLIAGIVLWVFLGFFFPILFLYCFFCWLFLWPVLIQSILTRWKDGFSNVCLMREGFTDVG